MDNSEKISEEMVDEILENIKIVDENIEDEIQATAFDYTDYRYLEQIINKQDTIIDNQQTLIYNQEQTMQKLDTLNQTISCICFIICFVFIYMLLHNMFFRK